MDIKTDMAIVRERAKELNINSFGVKKAELVQQINDAEANIPVPNAPVGDIKMPTETAPAVVYDEPEVEAKEPVLDGTESKYAQKPVKDEAPETRISQNDMLMALAKEMADRIVAANQPAPTKVTPEAELAKQHVDDAAVIEHSPKVEVYIEGGMGVPKYITLVVNGYGVKAQTGMKHMIQKPLAEVYLRSRQMDKDVEAKCKKIQDNAMTAGAALVGIGY